MKHWNKYGHDITTSVKNCNLGFMIDSTLRNIKRFLVLSLKNGNNDPMRDCFDKYHMS